MILIDTDVAVDLLRDVEAARNWVAGLAGTPILLPGPVAMELVQGAENKRDLAITRKFIKPFPLIWPDEQTGERAYGLFAKYHLSHSLGLIDSIIAAIAMAEELPLFTFNRKHYGAISGLTFKQPYKR